MTLLLLVYGLPASGKSYLCQKLVKAFESQSLKVFYLEFDAFIDFSKEFKAERDKIFQQCESFLKEQAEQVVILDDNFYYKSMRDPYRKLASQYSVGFVELYKFCDFGLLLERNMKRENVIPVDTIIRMKERFEIGDGLRVGEIYRIEDITEKIIKFAADFQEKDKSQKLQTIKEAEQKEQDRKHTINNLFHQINNMLNHQVSEFIKGKQYEKSLILETKQLLFAKIKSGEIEYHDNLLETHLKKSTHDSSNK